MNPLEQEQYAYTPTSDAPQPESMSSGSSGGAKKMLMWGVVLLILAAAAAGSYAYWSASRPVAVVNGENIAQSAFDARVAQAELLLSQGGADVNDPTIREQIRSQVLDTLITETLLLQRARTADIAATSAAVDDMVEQNRTQFETEAAFNEALSSQGFTEKTFRETLAVQLTIQEYLTQTLDLDSVIATDEEVQALYDQAAAETEDAPALEEVRVQVEAQVIQQKRQQLIADFLEETRALSDIEILI